MFCSFLAPFIVFPILFHHARPGPPSLLSAQRSSFPHFIHQLCQVFLIRSTNGAAESRSVHFAVVFRTNLALFPPSASTSFLLSEALLQHAECVQCNLAALEQTEIRIEPMQMMQGHAKPTGRLLWLLCSQGHQSYMPASDCLIRIVLMKAPERSCCT